MSGGGGQNSVSTSNPPQAFIDAYQNVLGQAQGVASQPLQQYQGQQVADFSPDQTGAFDTIRNSQGIASPYINAASQRFDASTAPLWEGVQQFSPEAVQRYQNPYTDAVVQATQRDFAGQNATDQQHLAGSAVAQGAYGGDRYSVLQAELAGQQQRSQAPVIAGLRNQGYAQALQQFNQQQGAQLGANQANAGLNQQAALGYGGLGQVAQTTALGGASAQLQAGQLQQQNQQARLDVPRAQFEQRQAYPFQTTSWLAGIQNGTANSAGRTTTQNTSTETSPLSTIAGLGTAGVGLYGLLKARGGAIPMRASGGGIAGNDNWPWRNVPATGALGYAGGGPVSVERGINGYDVPILSRRPVGGDPLADYFARIAAGQPAAEVPRYQPNFRPPAVGIDAATAANPASMYSDVFDGGRDTEVNAGLGAGPGKTNFDGIGVGPGERLPSTGMMGGIGRAGFAVGSSMLGPVGLGLGALNTATNAYNSYQNYNDLQALGLTPSALDALSGVVGGKFGGTLTDALDKMDPTGNLTGTFGGPVNETLGHLDAPGTGSRAGDVPGPNEGPVAPGGPEQGGPGNAGPTGMAGQWRGGKVRRLASGGIADYPDPAEAFMTPEQLTYAQQRRRMLDPSSWVAPAPASTNDPSFARDLMISHGFGAPEELADRTPLFQKQAGRDLLNSIRASHGLDPLASDDSFATNPGYTGVSIDDPYSEDATPLEADSASTQQGSAPQGGMAAEPIYGDEIAGYPAPDAPGNASTGAGASVSTRSPAIVSRETMAAPTGIAGIGTQMDRRDATGIAGATGTPAAAPMSRAEKIRNDAKWLAITSAGLGMMAGRGNGIQNIGSGAQQGLQTYAGEQARAEHIEDRQASVAIQSARLTQSIKAAEARLAVADAAHRERAAHNRAIEGNAAAHLGLAGQGTLVPAGIDEETGAPVFYNNKTAVRVVGESPYTPKPEVQAGIDAKAARIAQADQRIALAEKALEFRGVYQQAVLDLRKSGMEQKAAETLVHEARVAASGITRDAAVAGQKPPLYEPLFYKNLAMLGAAKGSVSPAQPAAGAAPVAGAAAQPTPAAGAKSAAAVYPPRPASAADAVPGKVYETGNGPMRWNGNKFVAP